MTYLWPGEAGPNIFYLTSPPAHLPRARKISLLGSTGSIGRNVLDVVRKNPGRLQIAALAGGQNASLMSEQAQEFKPRFIAMSDEKACAALAERLKPEHRLLQGARGFAHLAAIGEANFVVLAQSGAAGIYGALAAALAGKFIALANKESLVLAGPLLRKICKASGAAILPVDSEHNAIFQCLAGRGQDAAKILLTASGGPFFGREREELRNIGPEDALRHPNWKMGAKISIDSSTLMNKTLELVEAAQLFGVEEKRIEILIQPQSVIHSMVEMGDHSIIAQLGVADMRLPISFCLFWPQMAPCAVNSLNFAELGRLDFAAPDEEVFAAIKLGRRALRGFSREELSADCIVLNAANEICVKLFMERKISWMAIVENVGKALDHFTGIRLAMPVLPKKLPDTPDEIADLSIELATPIMELDNKAREWVAKSIEGAKSA